MKLKAKHGYWRTNAYPIGSDLRRAGESGEEIVRIIRDISPTCRGCDKEVEFANGIIGAVNSEHITD